VVCPLKAARRKPFKKHLNENISATEADDVLQSPADVPNDNPIDLDEGYINVEDPRPS
jgi:hypothetical protein